MNALTQEYVIRSHNRSRWQHTTGLFVSYQCLKTNAPVYFGDAITQPISNAITNAMRGAMQGSMYPRMYQQMLEQMMAQGAAAWRPGRTIILKGSWKSGPRRQPRLLSRRLSRVSR